jgi:hypothetical protein
MVQKSFSSNFLLFLVGVCLQVRVGVYLQVAKSIRDIFGERDMIHL